MKNKAKKWIVIFLLIQSVWLPKICYPQNVSVSESGQDPDPSAALDVISTNKGVLLPRLTTEERNQIVDPAEALIIFNTDNNCFQVFINNRWASIWCREDCVESIAPTGIAGTTDICDGDNTDLSVDGGLLGTWASWNWYAGGCGEEFVGTGHTINVAPTESTSYFVRAEMDCYKTACAECIVTVHFAIPDAATALEATDIGKYQFTANWQPAGGATSYLLQVSKYIDFSELEYEMNVGDVTFYDVTGLDEDDTEYHYRIISINPCGMASESNIISLTTCPDLAIGDSYGGGIVAGIDYPSSPCGILIAAIDDSDVLMFACYGTNVGGTSGAYGSGLANTNILKSCGAASSCYYSNREGYDDWFLPSTGENEHLWNHRNAIGGFSQEEYWSSYEQNSQYAHVTTFKWGNSYLKPKNEWFKFRCLRAF